MCLKHLNHFDVSTAKIPKCNWANNLTLFSIISDLFVLISFHSILKQVLRTYYLDKPVGGYLIRVLPRVLGTESL
jgi:hypothetical protein